MSGGTVAELDERLRDAGSAEELLGKLEVVLQPAFGASKSRAYAALLGQNGFDSSEMLMDLDLDGLRELEVVVGHRKMLLRAVFNGTLPVVVGEVQPQVPASVPVTPAPGGNAVPVSYVAALTSTGNEFKVEWPTPMADGLLDAAQFRNFGLALRAHLRAEAKDALASEMWSRVDNVSSDIPAGYGHADAEDAYLARILLTAGKIGMPQKVAEICSVQVAADCGMRAWQQLCKRYLVSTEAGGKQLKDAVRAPKAETRAENVANRLQQWYTALNQGLAKGYTFDTHDQRSALYALVEKLPEFEAVVAAQKASNPGGYPSVDTLRAALMERAVDVERTEARKPTNPKPKGAKARKAAAAKKAAAAAAEDAEQADTNSTAAAQFVKVKKGSKLLDGERPCRFVLSGHVCPYGDKCLFSHGDSGHSTVNRFAALAGIQPQKAAQPQQPGSEPEDKKSKFMAAMASLYDGGLSKTGLSAVLRRVWQRALPSQVKMTSEKLCEEKCKSSTFSMGPVKSKGWSLVARAIHKMNKT